MIKNLSPIIFLVILTACTNSLSDLNNFIEIEKSKPIKPIESLPEIKPMEVFVYNADTERDPFSNDLEKDNTLDDVLIDQNPGGVGPDMTRRKEFLEAFPLDSLLMVGTYQQEDNYWGLVTDPDGTIHRVAIGHFVGHNHGEILSISESQIVINEWINDGLGAWQERDASMALKEE